MLATTSPSSFLTGLLAAPVLLVCSVTTAPAQCDGESGLRQALLEHDKARIEFQYKMQTGYIRRTRRGDITIARERNTFLYARPTETLRAIQRHLRSLDEHGGVYALVFDPRAPSNCVWLIGPDNLVGATRLSLMQGEREPGILASQFRQALDIDARARSRIPRRRNAPAPELDPSAAGSEPLDMHALRRAVIPDVIMEEIQRGARTLLILPIGDLSTVPFAALPTTRPEQPLLDFVLPIVLPSVDGLFFWVKMADFQGRAVIVGDPDLSQDPELDFKPLRGAREEAAAIAGLIRTNALVGEDATHAKVSARLESTDLQLIHLATHGIADATNPMDGSFLALRERHLYAAEIKELRYHTEHPLVVMSSCQSGLGKTFNAGIFGLARAWVHAGAAQVLASLWNVDDQATRRLMTRFMSYYLSGMGSQRAFRQAMLETRTDKADIALWGSFTLFGYPQPER